MAWTIKYSGEALKALRKLDRAVAGEIVDYLGKRIAQAENPRVHGKSLAGPLAGLWRYRVRDYRIVCSIKDDRVVILVVRIGHRSDVYR